MRLLLYLLKEMIIDYFWYMTKNDAIVVITNSNLKETNGIL